MVDPCDAAGFPAQVQQWGCSVYSGSSYTFRQPKASALVSLGLSTEEDSHDSGRRRRRLKLVSRGSGYARRRLGAGDDGDEDAPLTLVLQSIQFGSTVVEQLIRVDHDVSNDRTNPVPGSRVK